MFLKLPTMMFLTCLAFIIFPKGSDAVECSNSELQKCAPTYQLHSLSMKTNVCSGSTTQIKCIKQVLDQCKSEPIAPALVLSKGMTTTELLNKERIHWGCDQNSGDQGPKISLIIIVLACMSAMKLHS